VLYNIYYYYCLCSAVQHGIGEYGGHPCGPGGEGGGQRSGASQVSNCPLYIPSEHLGKRVLYDQDQAFLWSYASAPPSPSSPVSKLDRRGDTQEDGERGAKSYDRKKAWYSINHSLFSDFDSF
jgi:hypothetical protein